MQMANRQPSPTLRPEYPRRASQRGKLRLALKEARETKRERQATTRNTRKAQGMAAGQRTREIPVAVATPFPPWKRRKTE
jgi:Flp pilus assembly protein CpaB